MHSTSVLIIRIILAPAHAESQVPAYCFRRLRSMESRYLSLLCMETRSLTIRLRK